MLFVSVCRQCFAGHSTQNNLVFRAWLGCYILHANTPCQGLVFVLVFLLVNSAPLRNHLSDSEVVPKYSVDYRHWAASLHSLLNEHENMSQVQNYGALTPSPWSTSVARLGVAPGG
jgi:hypothetical protein